MPDPTGYSCLYCAAGHCRHCVSQQSGTGGVSTQRQYSGGRHALQYIRAGAVLNSGEGTTPPPQLSGPVGTTQFSDDKAMSESWIAYMFACSNGCHWFSF